MLTVRKRKNTECLDVSTIIERLGEAVQVPLSHHHHYITQIPAKSRRHALPIDNKMVFKLNTGLRQPRRGRRRHASANCSRNPEVYCTGRVWRTSRVLLGRAAWGCRVLRHSGNISAWPFVKPMRVLPTVRPCFSCQPTWWFPLPLTDALNLVPLLAASLPWVPTFSREIYYNRYTGKPWRVSLRGYSLY